MGLPFEKIRQPKTKSVDKAVIFLQALEKPKEFLSLLFFVHQESMVKGGKIRKGILAFLKEALKKPQTARQ